MPVRSPFMITEGGLGRDLAALVVPRVGPAGRDGRPV